MPKEFKRAARVADLIQRELARSLQLLEDPRLRGLAVTGVRLSSDLNHARVYVNHYQLQTSAETMINQLNRAAGFLRSTLAKSVHMRSVPQLKFVYDDSLAQGARVSRLIDDALPGESEHGSD